jgi:hypothetical protein
LKYINKRFSYKISIIHKIKKNNNEKEYISITIASIEMGVSCSSILNNIKGLSKKTKVGIWNYKIMN